MRAKPEALKRLSHMRLDRKITVFLFVTVLVTALTLLAVTSVSAARSVTRKSNAMAVDRIESVSRSLEMTLAEYRNMIMMLLLNDSIQDYLKYDGVSPQGYTSLMRAAYQSVNDMNNVHSGFRYVAVLRDDSTDSFLYTGSNIFQHANSAQELYGEYETSRYSGLGTLRYDMMIPARAQNEVIFRLYQPLYDKNVLDRQIGLLCIGIDEEILGQYCRSTQSDMEFHIRLTDHEGTILYDLDRALIGQPDEFAEAIRQGETNFTRNGQMVITRAVKGWNIRLVGSIPTQAILSDSYSAIMILVPLISVITLLILFLSRSFVRRLYEPMRGMMDKMKQISAGDLTVSMDEENIGLDFREMVSSFNLMVVRLSELMERVKEEERRIEQIRFNALQSQIQPHFLYNTLECIHWQSASNGDKEVSKMVKALATYYRICLSKGRDIIPLSQEIAHIQSYLTIQNMRYDNIIQTQFTVDEGFYQVEIPKMTLQPLIENSIYHGIKHSPGGQGSITVGARREGGDAVVFVRDDGVGMSEEEVREMNRSIPEDDESFGYGVRNVHRRIEILFGSGYGLHYTRNESGGLTVEIRLPGERNLEVTQQKGTPHV